MTERGHLVPPANKDCGQSALNHMGWAGEVFSTAEHYKKRQVSLVFEIVILLILWVIVCFAFSQMDPFKPLEGLIENFELFDFDGVALAFSIVAILFTHNRLRESRVVARRARAAEAAAIASEARFHDLAEASGDWFWESGTDHRFTYLSGAIRDIIGRSPESLIGKTWWEIGIADDHDERWAQHRADLDAHRPIRDFTCDITDTAGRARRLRITAKPVFAANGRFQGYRGVASDITFQLEVREAAVRAQARMIDAIESMPADIFLFDEQERFVLCNSQARANRPEMRDALVPGATYEQILEAGIRRGRFEVSGDPDRWLRERLEGFRKGETDELRRVGDGRWIQVLDRKTSDGGTVGIRTDVTELKESERKLKEQSELLQTTLDSMDEGFCVFDRELRMVAWNARLLDLLGYPRSFAERGKPFADFVRYLAEQGEYGPGDVEKHVRTRMALARTTKQISFERVRPSGVVLETRANPMPAGGVVITYADITARKDTEKQLRQSQKMEAVGQMAGGMAHEFNNLLTAMGGFARMARRRPDDPERVQDCLDEVIKASDHAAGLTQQMLAFGRKQVLEPKVVRVAGIVDDLKRMLRPVLGELINLRFEIADDDAKVMADSTQLSQLIVNLAINARDAMPDGGDLTIGTSVTVLAPDFTDGYPGCEPGRYARLFVEDAGCGIDDETLKSIFEPFFTTKEPGQGTGLGLSVVYGIVEQSGGIINVESTPGVGSRFTVYLPIYAGDASDARIDDDEPWVEDRAATVLVVEDEQAVRRLIQQELESEGHQILLASDGEAALRVERGHDGPIDLLLTDVVMPRMGGVETARAISTARPGIRIIYMSGYPSRGQTDGLDFHEGAIVLQKPFDDRTLHDAVNQALAATANSDARSPVAGPRVRLEDPTEPCNLREAS
jgi:PAS domain S-box-containing protein